MEMSRWKMKVTSYWQHLVVLLAHVVDEISPSSEHGVVYWNSMGIVLHDYFLSFRHRKRETLWAFP